MNKILLLYLYGPANAGDMALNLGALDLLNSIGNFNITGVSRFAKKHPDFKNTNNYLLNLYDNLSIIPFPVNYDRNSQHFLSRIMSYLQGVNVLKPGLIRNLDWETLYNNIETSEYLFFNGGNMLFSRHTRDLPRLAGILSPLKIASSQNKEFAFLPQSIPGLNWTGQKLCKSVFTKSKFFLYRDSVSEKNFKSITPNSSLSLDLAFFIKQIHSEKAQKILTDNQLESKKFVPIIVRGTTLGDQGKLENKNINRIVDLIEKTISQCLKLGLNPVMVVQTRKDLALTQSIISNFRIKDKTISLIENYDPLILRGIYKEAAFTVSMRLHAAIFSLSVGTPCVCLYKKEWGPKAPGIYRQLGIENLVKDIDELSDMTLLQLMHNLTNNDKSLFQKKFLSRLKIWQNKSLDIVKKALGHQIYD